MATVLDNVHWNLKITSAQITSSENVNTAASSRGRCRHRPRNSKASKHFLWNGSGSEIEATPRKARSLLDKHFLHETSSGFSWNLKKVRRTKLVLNWTQFCFTNNVRDIRRIATKLYSTFPLLKSYIPL